MEKMIFIHDIKLPENDRFAERFNHVSDLWAYANEEEISEEERNRRMENFAAEKYCLEQGIGN